MRTLKDLKLLPVWVNPGHLISTALLIMRGHKLKALGVVDNGSLVGVVSAEQFVGKPETDPVGEAMILADFQLDLTMPIRRVADLFVQHEAEFAPVVDGEHFVGMVTAAMLLRELGRSWDPLTNLSWSDGLREWGIERLKAGQEITILFIDLDDFGSYNKQYGHIVGDKVLKKTAEMLREAMDDERDTLVRYGGDEFAIGTSRDRDEADEFAQELKQRMEQLFVDGVHEAVTFTIGLCGGKRTKERENVHFMSTLDSLINMASRESQARKIAPVPEAAVQSRAVAQMPDAPHQPDPVTQPIDGSRPGIVMVSADDTTLTGTTSVWLNINGNVTSGVHLREGKPLIESVATATADALRKAFPGIEVIIDNIFLTEQADAMRRVGVTGRVRENGAESAISATRTVGPDLYMDTAEATLEAFATRVQGTPYDLNEADDIENGQQGDQPDP